MTVMHVFCVKHPLFISWNYNNNNKLRIFADMVDLFGIPDDLTFIQKTYKLLTNGCK